MKWLGWLVAALVLATSCGDRPTRSVVLTVSLDRPTECAGCQPRVIRDFVGAGHSVLLPSRPDFELAAAEIEAAGMWLQPPGGSSVSEQWMLAVHPIGKKAMELLGVVDRRGGGRLAVIYVGDAVVDVVDARNLTGLVTLRFASRQALDAVAQVLRVHPELQGDADATPPSELDARVVEAIERSERLLNEPDDTIREADELLRQRLPIPPPSNGNNP